MEATVNVNVTVSLEEATIQSIGRIFTACVGGARPTPPPTPAPVQTRAAAPAPAPTPAPAPAPAPAPKAETIDNMTLNQAVKAAQARGVEADAIRAVFNKYGIKSSRECPSERRQALLDELNGLKSDAF